MYQFIKQFVSNDGVFYGMLLLLVGVSSFGLGRWSMVDIESYAHHANIVLTEATASTPTITTEEDTIILPSVPTNSGEDLEPGVQPQKFVGSKNGSKYHFPWCPGAKQMKEENKIWFSSKEDAEKAGYTPAANCKGL